ncbi:hypothetical protein ACWFMI_24995 [Nocardiopsis terrae]|uniref:hypothetical protein n=1 Tax=Streptomyces sp. NPDC057554 TaxID=3350538 RepID=UPI0036AA55EF
MANPAAPSDEGTRADILRWAAHQLRQTPIQCTALTGPVWYGAGWKDATYQLEELADGEARDPGDHDERSPLYERIAAAALTVPIRLGPATISNANAGHTVTRLSGSEADHIAHVVMDVLANRPDAPAEGYDPRAEVEAHWDGHPEQLIAAWEDDQAQWRTRVKELETALIGCGKPAVEDGPPLSLPNWAEREKQAPAATRAEQYEADRDCAQTDL